MAVAIGLALIGVSVALVTSALKSEPRASSRSSQIEAGRVMLENITRQLREGCKVSGNERQLAVYMSCDAGAEPFATYDCSDPIDQCRRIAEGSSTLMVSGLEVEESGGDPWPVFLIDDNYVEIQLRFPRAESGGGESVTLSDGVAIRNQSS